MCHHIPTDEREAFAEKLREEQSELEEDPAEAADEPEKQPEPTATPADD
jgi:hypothetical protein